MRRTVLIAALALTAVAVPLAVWAGEGRLTSNVERQVGKWTTSNASTSSTDWRNVPGLHRVPICSRREVSATLGVTVEGPPVRFRVVIDTPEAPMRPGPVRFVPSGRQSFSFTFIGETIPFEADDTHTFSVQWSSPSGRRVTLTSGVLNLVFERGTQGCP
jgi:hypothetical protein